MRFIDSHTHIYLKQFSSDLEQVLERSKAGGTDTWLLPAIDSTTHEAMMALEAADPGCKAMMGLHPCSVTAEPEHELKIVEDYLNQWSFIAVGEIGLDFYWDKTFVEQQYQAFHRQIELALERDLPIVIHSREATDECIQVVEQYPGLRGVFHCFSGNEEQARRAMATGFYLGIGGVVTFRNGGLDKVVSAVGTSRLLLETDAPYLAPVPYRGKRNEPSYIPLVAEKIAELTGQSIEDVARITTANTETLFRLRAPHPDPNTGIEV